MILKKRNTKFKNCKESAIIVPELFSVLNSLRIEKPDGRTELGWFGL
jgi:hypothetical protein